MELSRAARTRPSDPPVGPLPGPPHSLYLPFLQVVEFETPEPSALACWSARLVLMSPE